MREVAFEFDSQKELNKFPYEVKREVAHALYEAQQGGKHNKVRVLIGFQGAGMLEIRDQHGGCAYRVFYTTLIKSRICVLHAIKKKSTHGIATPKNELNLIKRRLKETLQKYRE